MKAFSVAIRAVGLTLIVVGPAALVAPITSSMAGGDDPFTIAILPDTQYYSDLYPEVFTSQTQWIVDNVASRNIVMVLHEGDIVNRNTELEWQRADFSLGLLDGVVPYLLVPGNHDMTTDGPTNVRDTNLFNATFPVSRFSSQPGFGGTFEADRLDNHYRTFEAGGLSWLVLGLEFGPRDAVLAWANEVVEAHPDHLIIVVTHSHLYNDDTLHGASPYHQWSPHLTRLAEAPGDVNDGFEIWNKFLARHPGIVFVFSGHVLDDGIGRLSSPGRYGNVVHQLLANFQTGPLGGEGYLRLVEIDPARNAAQVSTFSPHLGQSLSDSRNEFTLFDVGLAPQSTQGRPIADAGLDQTVIDRDGDGSETVALSAGLSQAPGGIGLQWTWHEGGTLLATGEVIAVPLDVGTHRIDLTVSSDAGFVDRDQVTVEVHPPTILLAERFALTETAGWTVLDSGADSAPSRWSVVHGDLFQMSNINGPAGDATTGRLGTEAIWSDPLALGWTDYVLSVTLGSIDDDGIGLVFRRAGDADYYKLDMDRQRSFRKLFRVVAGTETTLAGDTTPPGIFEDLPVRVRVSGSSLSITVGGQLLFGGEIMDSSHVAGTVALYSWGQQGAVFDDIFVQAGCGVPFDVADVTWSSNAEFDWAIAPFADVYDVQRGSLATLSSGATCIQLTPDDPESTDTAYRDSELPGPGEGWFYLLRGRSVLCDGVGGYGTSSDGGIRSCPGG